MIETNTFTTGCDPRVQHVTHDDTLRIAHTTDGLIGISVNGGLPPHWASYKSILKVFIDDVEHNICSEYWNGVFPVNTPFRVVLCSD
jgi:hypothetical protein